MNIYYEITDSLISRAGGKYFVDYGALELSNFRLAFYSNRIWKEDSQGVSFLKNRVYGEEHPCDIKEFFWIKLKCKTISSKQQSTN